MGVCWVVLAPEWEVEQQHCGHFRSTPHPRAWELSHFSISDFKNRQRNKNLLRAAGRIVRMKGYFLSSRVGSRTLSRVAAWPWDALVAGPCGTVEVRYVNWLHSVSFPFARFKMCPVSRAKDKVEWLPAGRGRGLQGDYTMEENGFWDKDNLLHKLTLPRQFGWESDKDNIKTTGWQSW